MRIEDILAPEMVVAELKATTKAGILDELASLAASQHPEIDRARLIEALDEREKLTTTALGDGVAIPHGRLPGLRRVFAAFGRSSAGVDFQAIDQKPTYLFFLLVAPEESAGAHLKALARISRLSKDEGFRARLRTAPDADALYRTIREEDARY
jgi:PTS system nitrogen regulatory IIA component